jgi:hypothetical protein
MKLRFSPITFTVIFCCAYVLAFWFSRPLFVYYPLHGDFTWGSTIMKNAGPGITWYGLMSDALISASILALMIPDNVLDRLFRNYLWLFPCAAMVTCAYLLRNFFLIQ